MSGYQPGVGSGRVFFYVGARSHLVHISHIFSPRLLSYYHNFDSICPFGFTTISSVG